MNMNYVRNGMWYGSRALFVASVVLVVLTATKVSGYMTSSGLITKVVATAKAKNGQDEESGQGENKRDHVERGRVKESFWRGEQSFQPDREGDEEHHQDRQGE